MKTILGFISWVAETASWKAAALLILVLVILLFAAEYLGFDWKALLQMVDASK